MTPDEAMAMAREAVQERARQLHYCAEGHTEEACWSDREHDAALDTLIELAEARGAMQHAEAMFLGLESLSHAVEIAQARLDAAIAKVEAG